MPNKKIRRMLYLAAITIIAVIAGLLAVSTLWKYQPKDLVINLTEFQGRIFHIDNSASYQRGYNGNSCSNKKQDALFVNVPVEQAIKWGKDAILLYNGGKIEILRPDSIISGMFFRCRKDPTFPYDYQIKINGKMLVAKFVPNPLMIITIFLVVAVIIFAMLNVKKQKTIQTKES